MRLPQNLLPLCLLLAFSAAAPSAFSQTPDALAAQPVPSRVVEHIDDARRVTLTGNTHPLARKQYETGLVEPSLQMDRILLVLKRSPEQDAALTAFNERQQDPQSPDYHHWLHADEFGRLYGPSDADITAITSWLQNRGFTIYNISKGRTMIQFSGTAAQVQDAFQVEMHKYNVNGEAHIANDRDPSIPEALSPVITGISSLHNFFGKPQHVLGRRVKFNTRTHKATPIDSQPAAQPKTPSTFSPAKPSTSGGKDLAPQNTYTYDDNTYEEMTPYDFATVYNILPLWNASTPITGKGVTIALSGVSDVSSADFNTFRSAFGLPATTLKTIVNGTDPGADHGGGQEENSLDVEMAGATAPGASIVLVVSSSTATTQSDQLSDQYIVDNEVAPIMSASYGDCELGLGTSGNTAFNKMWQQGSTEGISIFESSGDQGSAGCTSQDTAPPNADQFGLQVNGMASSPYVTGIGGTDFTWSFEANGASTYWNAANGTYFQSAKGIMPEVPWNSTCTSLPLLAANSSSFSSSEELCNGVAGGSYDGLIAISAGSGGVSHCTTSTDGYVSSCSGGYAKPSWQSGYGTTSNREVPDISLFAAGGFPDGLVGSAILFCDSVNAACNYGTRTGGTIEEIEAQEVGGTSASSPLWAGIAALIIQKTGGNKLGLINPTLYSLYAKQKAAGTSCNSSTVANGNSCTFYDITSGSNAQVCDTGGVNCVTNTSGDQYGVLSGYTAAAGYDDTTGLGTPNVANMVNAWPISSSKPSATFTPTSIAFPSTKVGSTSALQTVTLKNTSTGTITRGSSSVTGTNASSFIGSSTTCGTTIAAGATCTFSLEFKPATTGALSATFNLPISGITNPLTVALSGTGTSTSTVTFSPTSIAFPTTQVGSASALQTVTLKNSGTASITRGGSSVTGTNASSFIGASTTCGTTIAAGASCTFSLEFKPAAAGALTATFNLPITGITNPLTVALSGTGSSTSTVTFSPTSIAFPSTVVGSASALQTVTLKNSGTASITRGGSSVTGTNASSFIGASTTCGTTIAAGASCTFSLEFKPTTTGALTATFNLPISGVTNPLTVALSGTGTAKPSATLTPTSITFPTTKVGSASALQTVTLKNTGSTTITRAGSSVTGTNASSFIGASTTCGTTIAAGASCTFSLEFKPATTGALTATFNLPITGLTTALTVALKGTGD